MTWLQFFSTVLNSWPLGGIVLAFIFRHQIIALMERLTEVTLPGGSKVVFREALRESRVAMEQGGLFKNHGALEGLRLRFTTNYDALFDGLSITSQMIAAFVRLEQLLLDVRGIIGAPNLSTPDAVARELARQNLVAGAFVSAFEKLQTARNALVHVRDKEISVGEAIDFVAQAETLSQYLETLKEQRGKRLG